MQKEKHQHKRVITEHIENFSTDKEIIQHKIKACKFRKLLEIVFTGKKNEKQILNS